MISANPMLSTAPPADDAVTDAINKLVLATELHHEQHIASMRRRVAWLTAAGGALSVGTMSALFYVLGVQPWIAFSGIVLAQAARAAYLRWLLHRSEKMERELDASCDEAVAALNDAAGTFE